MADQPARQFSYHGLAVRMSARRPNGRVLLEYLQPKTLAPQQSWTEAWPHDVRSPGLGIGHIKSLIVALPLVTFVTDNIKDPVTAKPEGEAAGNDYWFNKI